MLDGGFSRRMLIFLGPAKAQSGLFSIGTGGQDLARGDPHLWLLTGAVDIESGNHSLRDVLLGREPELQMEVTCGNCKRKAARPHFTPITLMFMFHVYNI